MRRQIDRALDGGVSAVVACGKAGEFEGLSLSEVEEVLTFVVDHIAGRVPIGSGIISVDGDRGLQAADAVAHCGVDFAMVKKRSSAGLRDFFLQVAERVAGSASVMPAQEVELHRLAKSGQWDEARALFYERMLPLIAYATPDPYAFSVCKHLLYWNGVIESPVVRPPYEPVPSWMADEIGVLARRLELID